jgi:hypothetical protein
MSNTLSFFARCYKRASRRTGRLQVVGSHCGLRAKGIPDGARFSSQYHELPRADRRGFRQNLSKQRIGCRDFLILGKFARLVRSGVPMILARYGRRTDSHCYTEQEMPIPSLNQDTTFSTQQQMSPPRRLSHECDFDPSSVAFLRGTLTFLWINPYFSWSVIFDGGMLLAD